MLAEKIGIKLVTLDKKLSKKLDGTKHSKTLIAPE